MVCCVKRSYFLSFCLQSEMKNKENHHGGFQQQSPQLLVNKYEHIISNRNNDD